MRYYLSVLMGLVFATTLAHADPPKLEVQKSQTETSKTTTVTTPVGKDWHVGVEGSTKYTMPSKGPDGPEPGHQVGSSQNSSGAVIIQKRF